MATYVRKSTRGRTLHLLKIEHGTDNIYLDASTRIKEAEKQDKMNNYNTGGPLMAIEIEKAREYADYVGEHATIDTLYQYFCRGYYLFTEKETSDNVSSQ